MKRSTRNTHNYAEKTLHIEMIKYKVTLKNLEVIRMPALVLVVGATYRGSPS